MLAEFAHCTFEGSLQRAAGSGLCGMQTGRPGSGDRTLFAGRVTASVFFPPTVHLDS